MNITFCGGAGEVGASCILLKIDDKNILLDCGVRMKGGRDNLPDLRKIQEAGGVDAIIISHAHLDHTGALPVISREYPEAKIYMTHMTKGLVRVLLYDSLKIMNRGEEEIPIYAEKHVLDMLGRTLCFSPQFPFKPVDDSSITVTFYHAGHIAGAVMVYIEGSEGTVLYTGDISGTDQRTVSGASLPKLRPDVLIMESTYGDKLHSNRQGEEDRLIETVREVTEKNGKILIPAFALGRAQEVILILKKAMNRGELPPVNIYVDGMVKDINRVYKMYPNYLKNELAKKIFKGTDIFYDENIMPVENNEMRNEILKLTEPLCIISSSGMLTGGPSASYAEAFAANDNNFIAITGYQDEEAPGRAILELLEDLNKDRELNINGRTIPVKCGLGKYGLSAHSDKGELLGIISRCTPKNVVLVHGDREIIQKLGKWLSSEVRVNIHAPLNGESLDFSINNPRKQLHLTEKVKPLGMKEKFSEENSEELWRYLYSIYKTTRAFTAEELLAIWGGEGTYSEEEVTNFRDILNSSGYFTTDLRRLYLYRPLEEAEAGPKEKGVMEVNEMLRFVDSVFPRESRLYKKGARQEGKIALLYFSFPQAAILKYGYLIDKVEKETGWKVEINSECNLMEAEALINKLLPEETRLKKMSYFREGGYFNIEVNGDMKDFDKMAEEFKKITGLELKMKAGIQQEDKPVSLTSEGLGVKMEQNAAFNHIDDSFKNDKHAIYRKSKKESAGVPYIELSFITPEIGEKYREKLNVLQKETGWNLIIGRNPNQNEIIKIARVICEDLNISILKNPGIFTLEREVRIKTDGDINEDKKQLASDRMIEETGYVLRLI